VPWRRPSQKKNWLLAKADATAIASTDAVPFSALVQR
jgi:hypothetical protein